MVKKLTTKEKAKKAAKTAEKSSDEFMDDEASTQKSPVISKQQKGISKKDKLRAKRNVVLQKIESKVKTPQKVASKPLTPAKKLQEKKKQAVMDTFVELKLDLPQFSTKREDPTAFSIEKNKIVSKAKQRQKIIEKESEHFKAVLQHPSFKADPFETIRQHLTNSIQLSNESYHAPQPAPASISSQPQQKQTQKPVKKK